ncbi:MAG: SRPBCC family protein [Burkholderiales bacterium]
MSSATATVHAAKADAFRNIVPIDLTSIFTGYGPLPSVTKTLNATGPWDSAGRSRTVVFSDVSSATESVTAYDSPNTFSYRITGFTGALKYLASEARGQWWFESAPGANTTSVRWQYEFVTRFKFLKPLVSLFVRRLWSGYMTKALSLSKVQVEALPT